MTIARRLLRGRLSRMEGEEGSITPLILGFFAIALLFTGGAVALSDTFTKQRDLQSICDGAALAAANVASADALHGIGTTGAAIPLGDAEQAARAYLANDPARAGVEASGGVAADGATIELTCTRRTPIAFGAMIGKSDGVELQAKAAARSPLING